MKSIYKQVFILTLLLLSLPSTAAFTDISVDNEDANAIRFLEDTSIISGYPDGTFKPEKYVNRAELMKILVESSGVTPTLSSHSNCFPDVQFEWFAPYVCYAKSMGWVGGYPDGTFKPSKNVNRVEALKMTFNSQGISTERSTKSLRFNDIENGSWYSSLVRTGEETDVIPISEENYKPNTEVSRGEISQMIFRVIQMQLSEMNFYAEPTKETHSERVQQFLEKKKAMIESTSEKEIQEVVRVEEKTIVIDYSKIYEEFKRFYDKEKATFTAASDTLMALESDIKVIEDSTLVQEAMNLKARIKEYEDQFDAFGEGLVQYKNAINNKLNTLDALTSKATDAFTDIQKANSELKKQIASYILNRNAYKEALVQEKEAAEAALLEYNSKVESIISKYEAMITPLLAEIKNIEAKALKEITRNNNSQVSMSVIQGRNAAVAQKALTEMKIIEEQIAQLQASMETELSLLK